jgi:hypothetical protein
MRKISLGSAPAVSTTHASPATVGSAPDSSPSRYQGPIASPGSSAVEEITLPEQVEDIYLNEEYLESLALFRQEPIGLPSDPRLILDGVVNLGDHVDFVDHIMAPGGVRRDPAVMHPLTDRIKPELQSVTSAIYTLLNIRKSDHGAFRMLGANEAIELDAQTNTVSGRISDLVVYSTKSDKLPSQYVAASLAESLAHQGVKVFTDSQWQIFLVELKGGSSSGTTAILRCQPFAADLDNMQFMGYTVATNSRRFSTIRASELATVDKDGNHSYAVRMKDGSTGGDDDFLSLQPIGRQGSNPWAQSEQPSGFRRFLPQFGRK